MHIEPPDGLSAAGRGDLAAGGASSAPLPDPCHAPAPPPIAGFPALLGFVPGHLAQQGLELGEGIGRERRVPAALDGEPDRPVEGRHFIEPQPLGLPFPEANPAPTPSPFWSS